MIFKKICVLFLKNSKILSSLSCRLTQFTGKSKFPLHPKHLVEIETSWFLKYFKKSDVGLDLGCGNGQNTIKVALGCHQVIGLDNNLQNLKMAKKLALEKKINNIKFQRHNLEYKLPFKNKNFNIILCLDTLEHLNKRKRAFQEIKRVLKKNGLILITLPNKNTTWKQTQRKYNLNSFADPDHKIEYSLEEAKRLLKTYNFKIKKILPVTYDTPLAGFIDICGGFSLSLYQRLSRWRINKVKNNLLQSTGFRIVMENE
jgi:ubiquinone/menaquinone biosynthesis C-methylase UbiE